MRGESPATSARSLPLSTRRSWSSWITEVRQRRRTIKEEQLETVRTAREPRAAHASVWPLRAESWGATTLVLTVSLTIAGRKRFGPPQD